MTHNTCCDFLNISRLLMPMITTILLLLAYHSVTTYLVLLHLDFLLCLCPSLNSLTRIAKQRKHREEQQDLALSFPSIPNDTLQSHQDQPPHWCCRLSIGTLWKKQTKVSASETSRTIGSRRTVPNTSGSKLLVMAVRAKSLWNYRSRRPSGQGPSLSR